MARPVIPANRRKSSERGANLKKGEEKKRIEAKSKKKEIEAKPSETGYYWLALFVLAIIVLELFLTQK